MGDVGVFNKLENKIEETIDFVGSFRLTSRATTGDGNDYTATEDDHIVAADTSSSALTVTLPSVSVEEGKVYVVKDEGGNAGTNNVEVATEGSESIDGSSTATISSDHGVVEVYSDGTDWYTK